METRKMPPRDVPPAGSRIRGRLALALLPGLALALTLACGSAQNGSTAPTITSFSPSSDSANPADPNLTTITVNGSGFSSGFSSVTIGGVAAPSGTGSILSDSLFTVTLPLAANTGPIAVVTPGGSASSATNFTMVPSIATVAPQTGPAGTPVSLTGYGLNGISQITFTFGAATPLVANITSQAAQTLTFDVPAGVTSGDLYTVNYVNSAGVIITSNFTVN